VTALRPAERQRRRAAMRAGQLGALALLATVSLACGQKPPSITSFTADQSTIISGAIVTLSWQVDSAQSLTLDPGGISVTGRQSVAITPSPSALPATVIYTLTAQSGSGNATATTSILVTEAPATLTSFIASPSPSPPDQPVTLSWTARNATSLVLTADMPPSSPLPALRPFDTQATVTPHSTTVYTLTVTGPAATTAPVPLKARARVAALPTVTLVATPQTSTSPGSTVTLSWTSTDAADFTLLATPSGATVTTTHLGSATSFKVRPLVSTDYVVQALGSGGTGRSAPVTVTVTGPAATKLAFTPATPATGDVLQLVAETSPAAALVLDVKTLGTLPLTLAAFALDIPFDGGTDSATASPPIIRSRDGSARAQLDTSAPAGTGGFQSVSNNVFEVSQDLNPGTAPFSAVASLSASGPLAGVLTVGAARKPSCATCAGGTATSDASVPPGTVIAKLHISLVPGAGPGTVFAPGDLQAVNGYRAVVRNAAGASLGTVALGTLSTQ
jgi:hypothetical protein